MSPHSDTAIEPVLVQIVEAQIASTRATLYGLLAVTCALHDVVRFGLATPPLVQRVPSVLPPDVIDLTLYRQRRIGGGRGRG